jgi:hypothetical protein
LLILHQNEVLNKNMEIKYFYLSVLTIFSDS